MRHIENFIILEKQYQVFEELQTKKYLELNEKELVLRHLQKSGMLVDLESEH